MTIVIKIRDDLERSGDVLSARKKAQNLNLLIKNLVIVWRSTKSRSQSYFPSSAIDDRSSTIVHVSS